VTTDAALAAAARRYARAVVAHDAANGRTALELLLEREAAEHDLILAAGERCPYCSAGDCPGPILGQSRVVVDTPAL
jgi:hypothetical protein